MRLPSTAPQPAAASAGSICSALVSASFIGLQITAEGLMQERLLQGLERGEFGLVEPGEALGFFAEIDEFSDQHLLFRERRNWSNEFSKALSRQVWLSRAVLEFVDHVGTKRTSEVGG